MKNRRRFGLAAFTAIVLLMLSSSAFSAKVVYVKWDSPNDGPGNDWDHAHHTVTQGLNAAVSGNEVWVAKGTYAECITLKAGVELYRGFLGFSQRPAFHRPESDPNETVLDGNGTRLVVYASGRR